MSYCLNPKCPRPASNSIEAKFCTRCGVKLLLAERYRAIAQIGQGVFGRTFKACDEYKPTKPYCVIKQFFPQVQGINNLERASELFTVEAVQLDELGRSHPQIPELLAYFTQDKQQYLIQEFIDGQNLAEELKDNGVFNEAQIVALLHSLLPVLQFVHSKQVIHRDIKPENIIRRSDGELILVDFGTAKTVTKNALIATGIVGKAGYTSPEQAAGQATFASDIYSLGVTCLHLLTIIEPFELIDSIEGNWVWRDYLMSPVSNNLGQVLDKMVAGTLKYRYQSAIEVIEALNSPQIVVSKKNKSQTLKLTRKDIEEGIKNLPEGNHTVDLREQDLAELDLSDLQIFKTNLAKANLSRANLRNAIFRDGKLAGANLSNATLSGVKARNADMRDSNLQFVDFRSADLTEANLSNADLTSAVLTDAKAIDIKLINAKMGNTNLRNVDMRGAQLQGANLEGADLSFTVLRGAKLSKTQKQQAANLQGTNLQNSDLSGSLFVNTDFRGVNLRGSNLQGANASSANLEGSNLEQCHLEETNLANTNLKKANLRNTNLRKANLENASLQSSDLSFADLEGACLKGARYNAATNWPDGIIPFTKGAIKDETN